MARKKIKKFKKWWVKLRKISKNVAKKVSNIFKKNGGKIIKKEFKKWREKN